MGSEWKETTAGEFCHFTYGKSLPARKRNETGSIPVFGSGGLSGHHDEAIVKGAGIIIGRKGTVGSITYSSRPFWPIDTVFYVTNDSHRDLKFTYYLLKTLGLEHMNEDSAVPGLNREAAHNVAFRVPPPPEQKAIAHILGSLDDKIELNRRMNETLEGMAQALFKSWFVDFDPVIDNAIIAGHEIPEPLRDRADTRRKAIDEGKANREVAKEFPDKFQLDEDLGWIPEGWKVSKLSDLIEVKYGKDHKKLNDGNIPVYGSGGYMRSVERPLHEGESVLIPRKGTLSNILYVNEKFWTVDTMFFSIPKRRNIIKYSYLYLKGLDFNSMNVGSAVPSMTTKVLNELQLILPDVGVLDYFDHILELFHAKLEFNKAESQTLTKLRDTLLPKLISGELRIPQAEKMVE